MGHKESEEEQCDGEDEQGACSTARKRRRKGQGVKDDIGGLTNRSTQRKIVLRTKFTAVGIMKMMGVSGATMSAVGVMKLRKGKVAAVEPRHKQKLLRVFRNVVVKAAHAFTPKDPGGLIGESLGDVGHGALRIDRPKRSLAICKKGSRENMFVRALVHCCTRSRLSRDLIAKAFRSIRTLLRRSYGQKAQNTVGEATESGEGTDTCVGGNKKMVAIEASLSATRKCSDIFRHVYGSASQAGNTSTNLGT